MPLSSPFFASGGQSIGASVSASVLLMNIQDWLDLLAVQGTLKSLLQHHGSKASILQHSAFFTVQLSHPYMTTGKTIALTIWPFVGKVISLLFNMLSRLVIAFLPKRKHLLISWLQFAGAERRMNMAEHSHGSCAKILSMACIFLWRKNYCFTFFHNKINRSIYFTVKAVQFFSTG